MHTFMRGKTARVVALLALSIMVGMTWALHRQGSASRAALAPRNATTQDAGDARGVLDAPAADATHARLTVGSVESLAAYPPSSAAAPLATPAQAAMRVYGSVVVVDDAGIECRSESGTVVVGWSSESEIEYVEARVELGSFHVDVPASARRFFFRRATLRDRPAVCDAIWGNETIPPDGAVTWTLFWLRPLVVHVRDAMTKAELTEIEAELGWGARGVTAQFQGPPETSGESEGGVSKRADAIRAVLTRTDQESAFSTIHRTGDSPLVVEPDVFQRDDFYPQQCYLRARAHGYGWGLASFAPLDGGDVIVDLLPAASLIVDVSDNHGENGASLRVWAPGNATPVFSEALGVASRLSFEDLHAGRWTVAIEIGPARPSALRLASTEVELVAGRSAHVELALTHAPRFERADVSGLLLIPLEWNTTPHWLTAHCRENPLPEPDSSRWSGLRVVKDAAAMVPGFDTYAWSLSAALVGRSALLVSNPQYSALVDVPSGGLRDVRIEVPPPAEVRVRFVDAQHGMAVSPEMVCWGVLKPEFPGFFGTDPIEPSTPNDVFEFRAAPGTIHLQARGLPQGFDTLRETLTIVPGLNEFTLKLHRASGIAVTLMDGDRAVSWCGRARFELEEISGDGRVDGVTCVDRRVLLSATHPGRYRLTLAQAPPGYETPPPQIVELVGNETRPVTIALTRVH